MLANGRMVAIKRSQQGSMQGGLEFKTEIELLSRVHHKNLVGLVGFCFEQGEQMLVYEFIPTGTLRESLSGMPVYYISKILNNNKFVVFISIHYFPLIIHHRKEWHKTGLEEET